MSTLSPAMEATVARVISRARETEPRAAQPDGTGSLTGRSAPRDGACHRRVVSVPRQHQTCDYCGRVGAKVCGGCSDLPALDPSRAPELYGRAA